MARRSKIHSRSKYNFNLRRCDNGNRRLIPYNKESSQTRFFFLFTLTPICLVGFGRNLQG